MELQHKFIETREPEAYRDPWLELANQAACTNPFFSWEWTCAWYKNRNNNMPLLLWVQADAAGKWKFLLPFIQVVALKGKGLWPASYHTIDWANPLVHADAPETEDRFAEGVRELLKDYQFIWLPLLRPGTTLNQCKSLNRRKLIRPTARRFFFEIPENQEDRSRFRAERWGKKQIKNIAYLQRKLSRMAHWEFCNLSQDVNFDELLEVEKNSWKKPKGLSLYSNQTVERTYADVLPDLLKQKKIRLTALRLNGRFIAYEIGFLLDGSSYGLHHLAFDQRWSDLSPGKLLMDFNIQYCLQHNLTFYDFLQGNNEYKKRWANDSEDLMEVSLYANGFVPWLLFSLTNWLQKRRKRTEVRLDRTQQKMR